MVQTINEDLVVNGKLILNGNLDIDGSVRLVNNNNSGITAIDGYGNELNIVYVDPTGTILLGPGNYGHLENRFQTYIPINVDSQTIELTGKLKTVPQGMDVGLFGGGSGPTFPGTGALRFESGTTAGGGAALGLGGIFTTTDRRSNLWGRFNTESNDYIKMQFGLMASYGPAVYLEYLSGAGPVSWKCYTNNGAGQVGVKTFTGDSQLQLATFRRQFQISWANGYGSGTPSDINFLIGDWNNEFVHKLVHTAAQGSLPGVTEKLWPYFRFETTGNVNNICQFGGAWLNFEQ